MSRVFLAFDTALGRRVVFKVLRPELAADVNAERFHREIRLAASLQHPHIVPVHAAGQAAGLLYYTMPFVPGESLRHRLDRDGALSVPDALRILKDVTEALTFAHRRNVVHRDLKPGNILLEDSHALVADFGIAKALSTASDSVESAASLTRTGAVVGTPAYMSPEQAVGDPTADHRSDLYALGCLAYEILTGKPPFTGPTLYALIVAHVARVPEPVATRRPDVPPAFDRLVMGLLEKLPEDRPPSAEAVLQDLDVIEVSARRSLQSSSPKRVTESRYRRRALLMIGLGLVIGLALTAVVAGYPWKNRRPDAPPSARPAGSLPRPTAVALRSQLTFVGNIQLQEISPDGQLLAYVDPGPPARLLVQDLRGGSTLPISRLGIVRLTLRWSPDGGSLLYSGLDSAGQFWTVLFPRFGGRARRLTDFGAPYVVMSPDGSQLAGWYQDTTGPLVVKNLATGSRREIKTPGEIGWRDHGDWSPDGRTIALASSDLAGARWMLWTLDVTSGRWHAILTDSVPISPPRWSATGDALYVLRDENDLLRIPVALPGIEQGPPQILQSGLAASSFSITPDGRMLTYVQRQPRSNLWLATQARPLAPITRRQLTHGTADVAAYALSPDGRLLAYIQAQHGRGDLFVLPIDGGESRRVTSTGLARVERAALAWSPDGLQIAYTATVAGKTTLRIVEPESGEEQLIDGLEMGGELVWAPYDRILYQRAGNRNFHWLDLKTHAEEPLVRNDTVGWLFTPVPSPDSRHLAAFWNRWPRPGTYIISVENGSQRFLGTKNGAPIGWSSDGAFVYWVPAEIQDSIWRVSVQSGRRTFATVNPFTDSRCEMREELPGVALLCAVDESVSDVWKMENFDPKPTH
jgi:serine/threonine-protein kinase